MNSQYTIAYDPGYGTWYPSHLYRALHNRLAVESGLDIKYVDIRKLEKELNIGGEGYLNYVPSIFNRYNLLVIRDVDKKSYVYSFHDYAPTILDNYQKIKEVIDIVGFSCSSHLTEDLFQKYSEKVNIIPGFYGLENYNDYSLLEKAKNTKPTKDKAIFIGLLYSHRKRLHQILKKSKLFEIRKAGLAKEDYYASISKHKYGLSLDGAALICYRDIEYFGLGIINFRSKLNIRLREPLISGVHYVDIFDDEIYKHIYNEEKTEYIIEKLEHNIRTAIGSIDLNAIRYNAYEWYLRNGTLSGHLNTLTKDIHNLLIKK